MLNIHSMQKSSSHQGINCHETFDSNIKNLLKKCFEKDTNLPVGQYLDSVLEIAGKIIQI